MENGDMKSMGYGVWGERERMRRKKKRSKIKMDGDWRSSGAVGDTPNTNTIR